MVIDIFCVAATRVRNWPTSFNAYDVHTVPYSLPQADRARPGSLSPDLNSFDSREVRAHLVAETSRYLCFWRKNFSERGLSDYQRPVAVVLDLEHVSANQRRGFGDRIGMQRARVQQTTQLNFVHRHSRGFFASIRAVPAKPLLRTLKALATRVVRAPTS